MKNLAVDTSSNVCSVAILEDDKIIDQINISDGKTHSENLMPIMDEILKRNNIALKDINLISCCVGPGSFTGIRIGVATIKPIAEVLNIKVASCISLEVLARNVENVKEDEIIVSLIDARNNQVYAGIFDNNYNKIEDYMADDINECINHIKNYSDKKIILVGNGSVLHKDKLNEELNNIEFYSNNDQSAASTGLIGYKKYLEKDLLSADTIIPVYLRKSQAERLKKDNK